MTKSWRLTFLSTALFLAAAAPLSAKISTQEYAVLVSQFRQLRTNSLFPVHGYDAFSSTFGPRIKASSDAYDWHRGVDITGNVGDLIVAPLDGIFWRRTDFTTGGHTVILRHPFPNSVSLNGFNFNYFYTLFLHLNDDGIPSNGIGTDDIIDGWVEQSTAVTQGQVIAELGDSGVVVSPHLHLEIRIGTRLSEEFQIANSNGGSIVHYGFDPHVHPMLLFPPYPLGTDTNSYTNFWLTGSPIAAFNSVTTLVFSSNDHMPLLNRYEVDLVDTSGLVCASHVLDLNLRHGFDPTTNDALDTPETNAPYLDPVVFGLSATNYKTQLVVPETWLTTNNVWAGKKVDLRLRVYDIWGNRSDIAIPISAPQPDLVIASLSNQQATIQWPTIPGRSYQLEHSTNLVDWAAWPGGGTATINQILMAAPVSLTNGDRHFFRIGVD